VDDATTAVLRHTNRTLTSAAGALLLERLLTRTRYLTAAQCGLGALASSSKLSNHYLVDQRDIGLNVKQRLWEVDASGLLALDVN
jgi:hypothetical protein